MTAIMAFFSSVLRELLEFLLNPFLHQYFYYLLLITTFYLSFNFFFRKKRRKKLLIATCTFSFFYFIVLYTPLAYHLTRHWEGSYAEPQALNEVREAVIILGGGNIYFSKVWRQHQFGRTMGRVLEGLKLYKLGYAKKIIVSGGDPLGESLGFLGETPSTILFLKEMGVAEGDIHYESQSQNTYQEAVILKKLLPHWGIKKCYLVTDSVHMNRSMSVFEHQGLMVKAYPVMTRITNSSHFGLNNSFLWPELIHEILGTILYKWKGYL